MKDTKLLFILNGLLIILFSSCVTPENKSNHSQKETQLASGGEFTSLADTNTQGLLPPFTPTVIAYKDIPKSKVVGGRTFQYLEPRNVYEDPSGKWYITERPKGIFTYWHDHIGHGLDQTAYQVDFYSNDSLLESVFLEFLNPYTKEKYPALTGYGSQDNFTERVNSNILLPEGKSVSDFAPKAYTYIQVWESDQNYILADFVFVAVDHQDGYIDEEHSFVILDQQGLEFNRKEHIQHEINTPVISNRGRYLSYINDDPRNKVKTVILYDLLLDQQLLDLQKIEKRFTFGGITTLAKDPGSEAPYISRDECYLMISLTILNKSLQPGCETIPYYIDPVSRMIYSGCYTNADWAKFNFPDQHYAILREIIPTGIKF